MLYGLFLLFGWVRNPRRSLSLIWWDGTQNSKTKYPSPNSTQLDLNSQLKNRPRTHTEKLVPCCIYLFTFICFISNSQIVKIPNILYLCHTDRHQAKPSLERVTPDSSESDFFSKVFHCSYSFCCCCPLDKNGILKFCQTKGKITMDILTALLLGISTLSLCLYFIPLHHLTLSTTSFIFKTRGGA